MSEIEQQQTRTMSLESQLQEIQGLIKQLKLETNPIFEKNKSYWLLVLVEFNQRIEEQYTTLFDVSDQDDLDQFLKLPGTDKVLTASALKEAIKLVESSYIDDLTQVGNAKYWQTLTTNYKDQIQTLTEIKTNDLMLMVFSLDLDSFKHVNDLFGHQVGDEILKILGESLSHNSRPEDVVARKGGEEFAVIKPMSFSSLEKAAQSQGMDVNDFIEQLVEDFRQKIIRYLNEKSPKKLEGAMLEVTLSLGATNVLPNETIENALSRADEAMYGAKHAGKDKNRSLTVLLKE